MRLQTSVPVRFDPAAAEHVEHLHMQEQMQAILDQLQESATDLWGIEVTLEYDPGEERPPVVTLWAQREPNQAEDDSTNRSWADWFARTFPPEICEHFVLLSRYETANGR